MKFVLQLLILSIFFVQCTDIDKDQVKISGKITNPVAGEVSIYNQDTTFIGKVDSSGYFELSFHLDSSQYFNFVHGAESTGMYVQPGNTISISINTELFDETIYYKGSPASNFLANKYLKEEQTNFYSEAYYIGSSETYQSFLRNYQKSLYDELGAISDQSFVAIQQKNIEDDIERLIKKQATTSKLDNTVKRFLFKKDELDQEINFYSEFYTLTPEEFERLLNQYEQQLKDLIASVKDHQFAKEQSELLTKTLTLWQSRLELKRAVPKTGELAKDFSYPSIQGDSLSLSSFKGKLVYVDIWASWCRPCLAEIPALKQLEHDYRDSNIVFISVSVDDEKTEWKEAVAHHQLNGIQLWANGWSDITDNYAILMIPRFMLFDRNGKVIDTMAPRPSSDKIRTLIESYL